jgi:antitoxin (DNA-binding transcriptional repressor) of toxin-antitoxin stability system
MTTIKVEDIERDLPGYLKRVRAGETFLVLDADKPVAELKPVTQPVQQLRPFGLCAGEFTVPEDFDAPLPETPETYLPRQRERHLIDSLSLEEGSVGKLTGLPLLHRDPFDRMLICQALYHGLTIVTRDDAIRAYPVNIVEPA